MSWFKKIGKSFKKSFHKIGKKIKKIPFKKIGKSAFKFGKKVFHGAQKVQQVAGKVLNTASQLAPLLSTLGPTGQAAAGVIGSATAINNTFGQALDTVDAFAGKHGSEVKAFVDGDRKLDLPNVIKYGQTVYNDSKSLKKEIEDSVDRVKVDAKEGKEHFDNVREGIQQGVKRTSDMFKHTVGPVKRPKIFKIRDMIAKPT